MTPKDAKHENDGGKTVYQRHKGHAFILVMGVAVAAALLGGVYIGNAVLPDSYSLLAVVFGYGAAALVVAGSMPVVRWLDERTN